MTRDGAQARVLRALLALLAVGPLLVLPVRAVADVWRAPALVPQSWGLRGWRIALSSGNDAVGALATSLLVAALTTAVAVVLAWPAARVLGRDGFRAHPVAFTVLAAPLLVSPFATGTGLAEWFLRVGLADSVAGLVLAHLVYVLPYVVLLLAPAFSPAVADLEEVADSLGARPRLRLRVVTAPAVRAPLAAAALLGFLVSFSQYGTSLAVGGGLPTLPIVLLPFVGRDPQVASALALLFLGPVLVALGATARARSAASG